MPLSPMKLIFRRKSVGMTQEQAARSCGMLRPNYVRLERGGAVSLKNARLVAKALGCRIEDLIEE